MSRTEIKFSLFVYSFRYIWLLVNSNQHLWLPARHIRQRGLSSFLVGKTERTFCFSHYCVWILGVKYLGWVANITDCILLETFFHHDYLILALLYHLMYLLIHAVVFYSWLSLLLMGPIRRSRGVNKRYSYYNEVSPIRQGESADRRSRQVYIQFLI